MSQLLRTSSVRHDSWVCCFSIALPCRNITTTNDSGSLGYWCCTAIFYLAKLYTTSEIRFVHSIECDAKTHHFTTNDLPFQGSGNKQVQPHHCNVLPVSRKDPQREAGEGGSEPLVQPQQHQSPVQVLTHMQPGHVDQGSSPPWWTQGVS